VRSLFECDCVGGTATEWYGEVGRIERRVGSKPGTGQDGSYVLNVERPEGSLEMKPGRVKGSHIRSPELSRECTSLVSQWTMAVTRLLPDRFSP
jgi:hypothetical protein